MEWLLSPNTSLFRLERLDDYVHAHAHFNRNVMLYYVRHAVTYVRHAVTYVSHAVPYVRHAVTYVRHAVTYVRHAVTYVRNVML